MASAYGSQEGVILEGPGHVTQAGHRTNRSETDGPKITSLKDLFMRRTLDINDIYH